MNPALLGFILGAAGEIRPIIKMRLIPGKVTRGDRVQVQALFRNDKGENLNVAAIYMRILDSEAREIYPTSIMARNQAGMIIEISTAEFPPGGYTVQVSNHKNFSPIAFAGLRVEEPEQAPFIVVPPLPPIQFFKPLADIFTRQQVPVPVNARLAEQSFAPVIPTQEDMDKVIAITTEPDKEFRMRWKTMRDERVCPICDPLDGRVWEMGDDTIPKIPDDTHPRCRCVLEIVGVR